MRKEGDFSSVITLEKSKNQKTKKTGLNSQKTGLNSQKISGKRKMQFCENSWVLRKTPQTGSFFGRKKSESHPQLFHFQKKKILKMKKVERKTEIFFSQNESVCGVWGQNTKVS